jgi:NAD(P)-dependent dehydrogenase (short-subunit alcohol dehydrogenase family)
MNEKICLITGATDGIGKATAIAMAKSGFSIVVVSRNKNKGEYILNELNTIAPHGRHAMMQADLASFESIRNLAANFNTHFGRLDVLINNAGVFTTTREYTINGIELQFAVNHLAPFLLTNLLIDVIAKTGEGRIINVSSVSHRFGKIDFGDLSRTHRRYEGLRVYEQSKLANVLFTYELARRLKGTGITVNCLNPGRVRTNIGNKSAKGIYRILWNLNKPFLISPEQGAATPVFLATATEVKGISGKYFYKCRERRSAALSYREDMAERLWNISAELTGLRKTHEYTKRDISSAINLNKSTV